MDSIAGGSQLQQISLTKRELYNIIRENTSEKLEGQYQLLLTHILNITGSSELSEVEIRRSLTRFLYQFKVKWKAASRNLEQFLRNNDKWLETSIIFPTTISKSSNKGGRPSLSFSSSSERSKRRKTEALRSQTNSSELLYAAQMNLRATKEVDAAKVIKDVAFGSPARATKYRKAFLEAVNPVTQLSADKGLSLIVEAKLTRHQYNTIRKTAKENNCPMYPNYESIREAKKRCYPEGVTCSETSAEVNLQCLLNHTSKRILDVQYDVLQTINHEQLEYLLLISKWGCDGSSEQSEYKQKFESETTSDSSIFLTSFVPLQLVCGEATNSTKIVLWQNPRPSSSRYCRPVRLQFIKEDRNSTLNEKQYIDQQINALMPFSFVFNGKTITITHRLLFTMIDGKVCNAVSSTTSTQRCYLCGATSKDFNKLQVVLKRRVEETNLQFGLSTLHAWIRFFESLLHLSYRLNISKWQIRGEDKEKLANNKKIIQDKFKSQLGLIVDRPKHGYGSSNDGNTARRFFENTEISSAITGVDENLIKRFRAILQTISSGYEINDDSFQKYCLDTAELYVKKYPWYNMSTTVHKILVHGPQAIKTSILPIGQLSEEAQESRNKDIKKYREGFSRKCSRQKNLQDVFNLLLISSDPYISSMRNLPNTKLRYLSEDVLKLITAPEVYSQPNAQGSTKIDSNSTSDDTT